MPHRRRRAPLSFTQLEAREVPAVTLPDIADTDFANTSLTFLPVPATSSTSGTVSVSATSSSSSVTVTPVTGGQSLRLDVSGKDSTGAAFTGTLTFRLFEDIAPLATGRIIALTNQGFYDNLTFHRVIDNFVIQGGDPNGDGTGGSSLGSFRDEFNLAYTFNGNGILAMANSGDDTNDSQFFVTDIDRTQSQRPTNLNYNHTIFGVLTSGFDTFQKIITTPVNADNQTGTADDSRPTTTVQIRDASIFTDTQNNVLKVTTTAGFTGPADLTVTATDGDGTPATQTVRVTAIADTRNDNPILTGTVSDVTAERNGSVSFTLTGADQEGDALTFGVGRPANRSLGQAADPSIAVANVTASIDQTTGRVTLTPAAGFTGTIRLAAGVRDANGVFDTQEFNLTVTEPASTTVTLSTSSNTVGTTRPVLLSATINTSGAGSVEFKSGTTSLGTVPVLDGLARLMTTFATAAPQSVTATFTPSAGGTAVTSSAVAISVTAASAPQTFTVADIPAGQQPRVPVLLASDGSTRFTLQAFDNAFTGGVRVALADVSGDGQQDIVVVPNSGGAPIIRVFNGTDGTVFREITAFEDTFRGGLYVAAADVAGLGYAQILVGAGVSGGPRVSVYDAVQDKMLFNYFAYDTTLRGGVTVAAADLRGGLQFQIVTGAGSGGGPVVNVYDDRAADGSSTPTLLGTFVAGDANNRAGIRVGTGDIQATGRRNVLVGPLTPEQAALDQTFDPVAVGVFTSS